MASATVPARGKGYGSNRHLFSSSEDAAIVKQVEETHEPIGVNIDVKPLLHIINDVFSRTQPDILGPVQGAKAPMEALDDKAFSAAYGDKAEILASDIYQITREISGLPSGKVTQDKTMNILNIVSCYSWDVKVALIVAAFTAYYGEFRLITQAYPPSDPLAKSVAILKQFPEVVRRQDSLKTKYEEMGNLIRGIMKFMMSILEFEELPSRYISRDAPVYEATDAQIPLAAYWIVQGVVACAMEITDILSKPYAVAPRMEEWELTSLASMARKVNDKFGHFRKQLDLCYVHIDENRQIEAYENLRHLFEIPHLDNTKIIDALFYQKDDQLPLLDGSSKKRASTEVLQKKQVMLFISRLDISTEELSILEQIYVESKQNTQRLESHFEIVWLPVVDRTVALTELEQHLFEEIQKMMPWYTIYHPSMLDPAVIRFVKEVWQLDKKAKLVVLDLEGKVVNPNALYMIYIWGGAALPFTSEREESLWKEELWRVELLVDGIDPMIFDWLQDKKCICLYGGEDMDWIQKFTMTALGVAHEAQVPLEMLYVGKSNRKQTVRKLTERIRVQNLSHALQNPAAVWFFWARLESMWHSKMKHQHRKTAEENKDPIMTEIETMMSFDANDQGWAVFSLGSVMAKAEGDMMFQCLNDFKIWQDDVGDKGFMPAMIDYLLRLLTPHHCQRLIIPGPRGSISVQVDCAECGRAMEKYFMYRCSTDN